MSIIHTIWDTILDLIGGGHTDRELYACSKDEKGLEYLTPKAYRIYEILNNINLCNPEQNYEYYRFIKNVRYMHKYQFALNFIAHYGLITKLYAEQMVAQKLITPEIEKIYINHETPHLMYYINNAGHNWSIEAKQLMQDLRPRAYAHFF